MEARGDLIKWFSEINKKSISVAGGKGANLGEMYNLGVQVPPGFVITAQAYDYFLERNKLKEKIKSILKEVDYNNSGKIEEATSRIRKLITDSQIPQDLEKEILEAYENLHAGKINGKKTAEEILEKGGNEVLVAVRSSATSEDLEDASFAGQQETFLNILGDVQLLESVKKCFASLFTSRATYYREKKRFKHEESKLAVVVQKMVDSEKSGVVFSKDPSYKNENIIIEAVFGLGEGIVSGRITPDRYIVSREMKIIEKKISNKKIAITFSEKGNVEVRLPEKLSNTQVLKEEEIFKLGRISMKLEEHYKKPQDIEFAVENDQIYIVQTRAITTLANVSEEYEKSKELSGEIIVQGVGASPGISSGKIKIVKDFGDLGKINKGDVLVTKMTNPDMVLTMQKASAIVTDEGGVTSHAAIVSREMGIPAVVGTENATTVLKENEIITVNGFTGKVYKGKVGKIMEKEVLPVSSNTKTKIKIILDLPNAAERAARTGIKETGLTRIEGIIAESGKHPNYFLEKNMIKNYEEIIFQGIKKISNYFDGMWVRTSDIRSDEFRNLAGSPKEKEGNPMLGMHGIRHGLKHTDILKSELKALKKISESGKGIGILLPQVISVEEVKRVKEILKEINFSKAKLGVMIETPASVEIIKELCEEGIAFVSFGTNDLTQYTLAIDRNNPQVADIYNEMNPAVLKQISYVIRICKKYRVETSICGQAGSKKGMVEFLVNNGIDSISVNPDAAKEIAEYVAELEKSQKVFSG
ncbi:MAG TPA: phosphoenolpyruvate synthase [Candidatus Nanoarchaeia archaeon]|nr:phosphoenolpyruvate synthase [Candidatus Nanoarchaeia archaeon]